MKHQTVREAVLNLIAAVQRQQRPSQACRMCIADVWAALERETADRSSGGIAARGRSGRPRTISDTVRDSIRRSTLSTAEAAARFGVSEPTVRNLRKQAVS